MTTEPVLRCNNLKCRSELVDRAAITVCDHIFCEQCAASFALINGQYPPQACPACHGEFKTPDSVVLTSLNPSESFKATALSGLPPSVIMDCASRAMNFYQHQMAKELQYQLLVVAKTTEHYGELSKDMDALVDQANKEIRRLQGSLSNAANERQSLIAQNLDLGKKLKGHEEREKELNNRIGVYEGQASAATLEDAAAQNVNRTVQEIHGSQAHRSSPQAGFGDQSVMASRFPTMPMHGRRGSSGSNGSGGVAQHQSFGWNQGSQNMANIGEPLFVPQQNPLHIARVPPPSMNPQSSVRRHQPGRTSLSMQQSRAPRARDAVNYGPGPGGFRGPSAGRAGGVFLSR